MNINKSGYYKWKKRKGKENCYQIDRRELTQLLLKEHNKHKAIGYRALAQRVRNETGWMFSDNLVHKCCKYEGIKSKAKHYQYKRTGEENIKFKNIINNDWNTTKPLQKVCSDMTTLFHKGKRYEWVYILDTFNNEIIASSITDKIGNRKPYYDCLEQLKEKVKEQTEPVVFHTDQGSVYSSEAFFNAHKDYTIKRSMSRGGTPTDNAIIESLNGWIKAEIKAEYKFNEIENVYEFIDKYITYFNEERLSYKLKYKSPIQYKIEQGF